MGELGQDAPRAGVDGCVIRARTVGGMRVPKILCAALACVVVSGDAAAAGAAVPSPCDRPQAQEPSANARCAAAWRSRVAVVARQERVSRETAAAREMTRFLVLGRTDRVQRALPAALAGPVYLTKTAALRVGATDPAAARAAARRAVARLAVTRAERALLEQRLRVYRVAFSHREILETFADVERRLPATAVAGAVQSYGVSLDLDTGREAVVIEVAPGATQAQFDEVVAFAAPYGARAVVRRATGVISPDGGTAATPA